MISVGAMDIWWGVSTSDCRQFATNHVYILCEGSCVSSMYVHYGCGI